MSTHAKTGERVSKLYGVRATSQGMLFVQPLSTGDRLTIAGDFNDWNAMTHPMRRDEQLNVWQACIQLPPGQYRYRLVVDGQWIRDAYNPNVEANPFGGLNSVVEAP